MVDDDFSSNVSNPPIVTSTIINSNYSQSYIMFPQVPYNSTTTTAMDQHPNDINFAIKIITAALTPFIPEYIPLISDPLKEYNGIPQAENMGYKSDYLRINIANNVSHWMSDNSAFIENKPYYQLFFPNSHNAGTYGINSKSAQWYVSERIKELHRKTKIIKIYPLVAPWSITQHDNILTTLNNGIRLLDLRLCYDPQNPSPSFEDIYTCHALSGASMKDIIKDIKTFINTPENKKEIITLKLRTTDNLDVDNMVISKIEEIINDKKSFSPIVNFEGKVFNNSSSTLKDLWNAKKQIIILGIGKYNTNNHIFNTYYPPAELVNCANGLNGPAAIPWGPANMADILTQAKCVINNQKSIASYGGIYPYYFPNIVDSEKPGDYSLFESEENSSIAFTVAELLPIPTPKNLKDLERHYTDAYLDFFFNEDGKFPQGNANQPGFEIGVNFVGVDTTELAIKANTNN